MMMIEKDDADRQTGSKSASIAALLLRAGCKWMKEWMNVGMKAFSNQQSNHYWFKFTQFDFYLFRVSIIRRRNLHCKSACLPACLAATKLAANGNSLFSDLHAGDNVSMLTTALNSELSFSFSPLLTQMWLSLCLFLLAVSVVQFKGKRQKKSTVSVILVQMTLQRRQQSHSKRHH